MPDQPKIRESRPADSAAIESLYPDAFPDEELLPLVRSLSHDTVVTTSLVAETDIQIVGHALFTKCGVAGSDAVASLLGPLAVGPAWQRQGIGSAIVREGLRRLDNSGVSLVLVLGDPIYYGRLGFRPESGVEPPFPLPPAWDGAWQSQYLRKPATPCAGKLLVPSQWDHPELWAP